MSEDAEMIVLGPPLCGKSVQSRMLASKLRVQHISTGQIFRDAVARESEVGLKVKEIVQSGRLVPDEVVIDVLTSWLGDPSSRHGFVLDGFPRTLPQALFIDQYFGLGGMTLDAIVILMISEQEIFRRAAKRRIEEKRADDESDASLFVRLGLYKQYTEPAIKYFEPRGIVHYVDGSAPIPDVFEQICQTLRNAGKLSFDS